MAGLVFLAGIIAQTFYCFERPKSGFDTIIYVSLLDGGRQQTFREAAVDCSAALPGPHNGCDNAGSFREVAAYSPADYSTFLRFYRVKPLYTYSTLLLYRVFHLSGFVALRTVSAASFLVIGLTLVLWLRHHLSWSAACLAALLIVSFPPVIDIGKFLLPDAFSAALVVAALYAIVYLCHRLWIQVLVLAVLPLARTDNLILSLILGAVLIYRASSNRRQLVLRLAMLLLGCGILNFVLSLATDALPYAVLFHHSFLDFSTPGLYASMHLSVHDYARIVLTYAPKTIVLFFPLPLFFAFSVFADRSGWRPLRDVVIAATASAFARLLLFPAEEERYYTWWLVIVAAAAAATLGERKARHTSAGPKTWAHKTT